MEAVSHHYTGHDGLRLHYREFGEAGAPLTVICIPGLTRNHRDFAGLAGHLAQRYRVLCIDLRGRGGSEYASDPMSYVPQSYVDDLALLFAQTKIEAAALIGTSLGALISTLFAALLPEHVLGVVLNDAGPEIDPRGLARIAGYVGKPAAVMTWQDAADFVQRQDGPLFPDFGEADWLRAARQRFAEGPDGVPRLDYDADLAKAFGTPATTPGQWPYFRQLRGLPALSIRGAESDILARATVGKMQAEVPALQALEVPGRGHTPTLEEPVSLAAIDRFLASLPARLSAEERASRKARALQFLPEARRAGIVRPGA